MNTDPFETPLQAHQGRFTAMEVSGGSDNICECLSVGNLLKAPPNK